MRKALQIIFAFGGTLVVAVALMVLALGPESTPGFVPGNATMDSEARFNAVMLGFLGAGILWCISGIERKGTMVRLLMAIIFLGGLGRVVSALAVGRPNAFFQAMMALELALPLLVVLLQMALERQAPAPSRVGYGMLS